MKYPAIIVLSCLLTGAAYAQSVSERAASAVGLTPSSENFVKTVAISDMFEIESSKLAEQRADAKSQAFAKHMIEAHTKTSAQLKGIAAKLNLEVPSALDSSHQSKIDTLRKESGPSFDDAYDGMQVDAHKDAISFFERYAEGGDNAELKAWAAKTLPELKSHLQMAQALD